MKHLFKCTKHNIDFGSDWDPGWQIQCPICLRDENGELRQSVKAIEIKQLFTLVEEKKLPDPIIAQSEPCDP